MVAKASRVKSRDYKTIQEARIARVRCEDRWGVPAVIIIDPHIGDYPDYDGDIYFVVTESEAEIDEIITA